MIDWIKTSAFRTVPLLCLILLWSGLALPASGLPPAATTIESKHCAAATVHIKASQATVWKILTDVGQFDDIIDTETPEGAIVEQRFFRLPLFGEMVMAFKVTTTPPQKVEFNMIRSNFLKAFNGDWLVTPINTSETKVELHAVVEPVLPIPQYLVNQFVSAKLHKRLLKLKKLSESLMTITPLECHPARNFNPLSVNPPIIF